ncbi:MAG: hypothetical protein ABSF34_02965, partial [Verrucomicrobiota bacterium]
LRAAVLLAVGFVGSFLTARSGDARNSPPRPQPKSPAAGHLRFFRQSLKDLKTVEFRTSAFIVLSSRTRMKVLSRAQRLKWAIGKHPIGKVRSLSYGGGMNLLLLILVLLLLFGGGGFYFGGPMIGGGALGLLLLICIVVYFAGGFRSRI